MNQAPGEGGSENLPRGRVSPVTTVLLLASLGLAGWVLFPLVHALVFAAVLAHLTYPVKKRLERAWPGRPSLGAFLVVCACVAVIILPATLLVGALAVEGAKAMTAIQGWVAGGGMGEFLDGTLLAGASDWLSENLPFAGQVDLQSQLSGASEKAANVLLGQSASFAANTAYLVANLFIIFFILFYFVRDGEPMLEKIRALSPLGRAEGKMLLTRLGAMANAVFLGSFLTAIAQGVAGGVGLALAGLPGFFWGAMMAVTSLVPVVGTALIWVPATLYLLLKGHALAALFLAAWCVLLVGSIDNFLRPFLMSGEGSLPPFFIFLAVVGGLSVFGLPGLLYGPLILTLVSGMIDIYSSGIEEPHEEATARDLPE